MSWKWLPDEQQKALRQVAADIQVLKGLPAQPEQYAPVLKPGRTGGLVGAWNRIMFGKPNRPALGQIVADKHLPLANQLTRLSANLLFGSMPTAHLAVEDENNLEAMSFLDELTDSDMFAVNLHRAATDCAGLGWVYGKLSWRDEQVNITWHAADQAYTIFKNGRPDQIVFWYQLEEKTSDTGREKVVYRMLETHDAQPVAAEQTTDITYQVHKGTKDELGPRIPWSEWPYEFASQIDTENWWRLETIPQDRVEFDDPQAPETVLFGAPTGTRQPTAVLITNSSGNFNWRAWQQISNLGQSDVAAAGSLWADLDLIYTDLVYEIEQARAKLFISEELLEKGRPGEGQWFDWARDVYRVAANGAVDGKPTFESVQFQMRVEQYLNAMQSIILRILDAVGISPITAGYDTGTAVTATEIRARSEATLNTWRGKSRHWRAGLSTLLTAATDVHLALHNQPALNGVVSVAMVTPIQDTELEKAQTLQALRDARAISTGQIVERLHPEWDAEQKAAEVEAIRRENSISDPLGLDPDQPLSLLQ